MNNNTFGYSIAKSLDIFLHSLKRIPKDDEYWMRKKVSIDKITEENFTKSYSSKELQKMWDDGEDAHALAEREIPNSCLVFFLFYCRVWRTCDMFWAAYLSSSMHPGEFQQKFVEKMKTLQHWSNGMDEEEVEINDNYNEITVGESLELESRSYPREDNQILVTTLDFGGWTALKVAFSFLFLFSIFSPIFYDPSMTECLSGGGK